MVITAIPAGFAAGLFGIGGGLITVPILFYIFGVSGIEPDYLMHLAVGTSFGIIIPTSFVSVLTHHQHNAVDFNVVKGYGVFVIIGVILGTYFSCWFKNKTFNIIFYNCCLYSCFLFIIFKRKESDLSIKMGLPAKIISGIITGFVSAPMGIGGAVMNVPILKFFGYPINKAIGSAAAIGFIIALFGTIGFLFSGNYLNANLPLSIGFLNIPAFLIFSPITAFMARLGAKASHRIDKKKMTKYFGLFLIIIGTKFLYEYFNL